MTLVSDTDQIIPYVLCVRCRISSVIFRRELRYSELKDEEEKEEKDEKGKTKEKEEVKDEKGKEKEKERVEEEM